MPMKYSHIRMLMSINTHNNTSYNHMGKADKSIYVYFKIDFPNMSNIYIVYCDSFGNLVYLPPGILE